LYAEVWKAGLRGEAIVLVGYKTEKSELYITKTAGLECPQMLETVERLIDLVCWRILYYLITIKIVGPCSRTNAKLLQKT